MDTGLLFDPLFRLPFVIGLLVAAVLPLLGALLMLREEWLAALGLAHLAAAGALAGLAFGTPAVVGAGLMAALGAGVKALVQARGNAAYGFMTLFGWSAMMLVAANTPVGETLGHALVDGQLYFSGPTELGAALGLAAATGLALPWLGPRLLRARFFPRHDAANRLPAWRWHLGFDLLAALGMAVGTATLGLMGAFALILVPAWIAFRLAHGWHWTLALGVSTGVGGYLASFALAMGLDQPFGPVLVAVLLGESAVALGLPAIYRVGRRVP